MARKKTTRPETFVPLGPDVPATAVPIPEPGLSVAYRDPGTGGEERAWIVWVARPGDPTSPVDLVFMNGRHLVHAVDVEPEPGRFGSYKAADRGPA